MVATMLAVKNTAQFLAVQLLAVQRGEDNERLAEMALAVSHTVQQLVVQVVGGNNMRCFAAMVENMEKSPAVLPLLEDTDS